eukprot:6889825-Alexandrium_andersonii.AAC.1
MCIRDSPQASKVHGMLPGGAYGERDAGAVDDGLPEVQLGTLGRQDRSAGQGPGDSTTPAHA